MGIEKNIAIRYLRAKRRNSLLSLISILAVGGVGLGVAALIVVLAVLAGFEQNLFSKLLGFTAHVTIYRAEPMTDWPELIKKIRSVPGVDKAVPFIRGQVMITASEGANGVLLLGLDPKVANESGFFDHLNLSAKAEENLVSQPMQIPWEIPPDEFGLPQEPDPLWQGVSKDDQGDDVGVPTRQRPIIIGRELSYILGVQPLSRVKLISPFGRVTPLGNRAPLNRIFTVAGTFQANYYDFDTKVVYTTLEEAQDLLGMNRDEISLIEIYVDDIYKAEKVKSAVLKAIGDDSYWARDWMQMNLSLFSALKLEQTSMFVILTLIILVAAFNIASTLIMMVTEKTRDIAILKAMGATSSQVKRIFTIQGLLVGSVGTLGGLAVGVILCLLLKRYEFISLPQDIYLMSTLPVEIRPLQIVATTVVSLIISYLATLYPAQQAAKLDPVEALRYE
ncbi:MAG: ABC transporter permease [Deltaproteobacteria bacterium]|jgi:lipoprotein-releasing system permease protein|nr:ABC transporter permease [Deltaproteobacteria bacterium]